MQRKLVLFAAVALTLAGCRGSEPAEPDRSSEPAARQPSVFDPLTSTIGRAQSVQETTEEQAAEQRRRIEEAER